MTHRAEVLRYTNRNQQSYKKYFADEREAFLRISCQHRTTKILLLPKQMELKHEAYACHHTSTICKQETEFYNQVSGYKSLTNEVQENMSQRTHGGQDMHTSTVVATKKPAEPLVATLLFIFKYSHRSIQI